MTRCGDNTLRMVVRACGDFSSGGHFLKETPHRPIGHSDNWVICDFVIWRFGDLMIWRFDNLKIVFVFRNELLPYNPTILYP
jgi:hypothetical protein